MRLLLLAALAAAASAAVFRARHAWGAEGEAQRADRAQDLEEKDYWAEQWGQMQEDLQHLKGVAVEILQRGAASEMQLGTAPAPTANATIGTGAGKAAPTASKNVSANAAATASKNATAPKAALTPEEAAKLAASLGGKPAMNLAASAMLAPMLGMLKDMYEQARNKIGTLNKHEKESKARFAAKEIEHAKRMARINSTKLVSAEFRFNETRDEDRMFSNWKRARDREHRQYHTMLKMQHAMMTKEKTMIDLYTKTLDGKGSTAIVKKELHSVGADVPEVVLVQAAKAAKEFCLENLAEASRQRVEVKRGGEHWEA